MDYDIPADHHESTPASIMEHAREASYTPPSAITMAAPGIYAPYGITGTVIKQILSHPKIYAFLKEEEI